MTKREFKLRLLLQNLGNDCTDIMDINHTLTESHPHYTGRYSEDGQSVMEEILCAIDIIANDDRISVLFEG